MMPWQLYVYWKENFLLEAPRSQVFNLAFPFFFEKKKKTLIISVKQQL